MPPAQVRLKIVSDISPPTRRRQRAPLSHFLPACLAAQRARKFFNCCSNYIPLSEEVNAVCPKSMRLNAASILAAARATGLSDVWVSEDIIVPHATFPRSPLFYDPVLA